MAKSVTRRPRVISLLPRTIPLGLAIVIALSLARIGAAERGDVNGDGIVNFVDAGMIKDHLLERTALTSGALTRADADGDGLVRMADVVWVVNHRYTPPVKAIGGWIDLPNGCPLQPTGMEIVAAGGSAPIDATWHFAGLPAWDTGAGQFVFVEDAAGSSVLMGYVDPAEVASGTLVFTPTHIALGLIAMHPVCFSIDDAQRRELLALARANPDFSILVQLIVQALLSDPLHLGDYDTFPQIFELAIAIGNAAARAWTGSPAAPSPPGPTPLTRIGASGDPHLDDWPGNGMTLVNPHLLFYGVQWGTGNDQWDILRGKDGLTQLIPPSFTPDIRTTVTLANGNYYVEIWKGEQGFGSTNPAIRAAAHANVYKTLLTALDALATVYAPGISIGTGVVNNNELIEFLVRNPNRESDDILLAVEGIMTEIREYAEDEHILKFVEKLIDRMANHGVYQGSLAQKVAHVFYNLSDVDGRAYWRHFSRMNRWIRALGRVTILYPIFNDFIPYWGQLFFYRNHYAYQVNVSNGVLSAGWQRIAPDARLTASTAYPAVGQTVTFDASASTDDADPLSALSFRFDFDANGAWDTAWALGNAVAQHSYSSTGRYNCIVEVKDTDNLTGQARYSLYVTPPQNGTITINVTPDAGSWRLVGPAGFTSLNGTGDRLAGTVITNAPAGAYTLACNDNVTSYNPPAPQTKTLTAGEAIAFTPTYSPESGPNELTINLPGNVPLVLVRIPAGSFQMGSPDTERSRWSDEGPVHTVNIAYSFYMGKNELTQRQWLALMGDWPGSTPSSTYGLGDNYPAYNVSWNDAQNFITALNTHITNTSQGPATFRLPSEAEWEYACRAGTQTRFFFGDSLSVDDGATDGPAGTLPGNRSDYMWFWFNCQGNANGAYGSKPVGTKLPNQFGLYDMSGNVMEWCQDYWHGDYTGAPANGSAWELPTSSYRVLRGGGWGSDAYRCRSASRNDIAPAYRSNGLGFRFVWTQ
jgi:formylglycine-generating enzyme required for sulfatase activity